MEKLRSVAGHVELSDVTEDELLELETAEITDERKEHILLRSLREMIKENLGRGFLENIYRAVPDLNSGLGEEIEFSMEPILSRDLRNQALESITQLHDRKEIGELPLFSSPSIAERTQINNQGHKNPHLINYIIFAFMSGFPIVIQYDQLSQDYRDDIIQWYWSTNAGGMHTHLYTERVDLSQSIPIFDKDGGIVNWVAPRSTDENGNIKIGYYDAQEPDWRYPSKYLEWPQLTWSEKYKWDQLTNPDVNKNGPRVEYDVAIRKIKEAEEDADTISSFFRPRETMEGLATQVVMKRKVNQYKEQYRDHIQRLMETYGKDRVLLHTFPNKVDGIYLYN